MKRKDIIKLILSTLLVTLVFGGSLALGIYTQSDWGFTLSVIFGLILVFYVIGYCYPIWFEEYIEEYWRKVDEKNEGEV